jgi:hypothetical protein
MPGHCKISVANKRGGKTITRDDLCLVSIRQAAKDILDVYFHVLNVNEFSFYLERAC